MNVAIIGCGFIGEKRARALAGCRLVACADVVAERAQVLARKWPGAVALSDWRAAVERADVDIVIVATTHDALPRVTLAAVQAGKHVLVEKPAARRAAELDPVISASLDKQVLVRVGFNHRYHPSFIKAREISASGALGQLMFIRGRYGHGGRIGYDQEWRANKELSGGGELIDQGVHLIDLARSFLGEFSAVQGFAHTYFWNMPVEDNGFMLLKTPQRQVAMLHASWTEWKNTFSFEIYGRDGKLEITGLGGSYGVERLAYYRMLPQMGPPETVIWEYPMGDSSWDMEFAEFVADINLRRQPAAGLADARAALAIVEKIYQESGL
ncbi:MAG TPA: LmbZ [Syntrophobacteraceae bacterium]|nr:LmbZ [Syntrophobacteraceae bacterium]HBD10155.1 LmbZ [Syntrophobacteraceae bacterium]